MDQSQCSEAAVAEVGTAQEWLQPLANDPFQNMRKLWTEGLCKPLLKTHSNESSRGGEAPSSILKTDPTIIIVQNLKNVLQSVNFGGGTMPTPQEDDGCTQSLTTIRSSDLDAACKLDDSKQEEEEMVEEETLAVITRPGTSRAVRVQKALETFFLSLALVYLTIRILRGIDADFDLEIYTSDFCESSFISIAQR